MGHARAITRLLLVGLTTGIFYAGWLATRPLGLVSPRAALRAHFGIVKRFARTQLALLGARVDVRGEPPRAPFVLVTNHLSYVDIAVLMGRVDGFFLSKSEVAHWPLLGFLARSTGTLFVDREKRMDLPRVIGSVERVLARGAGVVLFPEGTSSDGREVLPFKPSLFEVALRTGTPVSHAALSYGTPPGTPPARLAVCWWGDMTFPAHFYRLLMLPGFHASLSFGRDTVAAADRKSLARRAHRAVTAEFVPVGATQPE